MIYSLKELSKDLKRLDKKAEALGSLKLSTDEQEKLVAPVYFAKKVELLMKYFDVKVKVNEIH